MSAPCHNCHDVGIVIVGIILFHYYLPPKQNEISSFYLILILAVSGSEMHGLIFGILYT